MKPLIFISTILTFFLSACDENVYHNTYETDPRFFNDAFHGHIVGKVLQKQSGAIIVVSQVNAIDSAEISAVDGSFSLENLEIGNYDLTIKADNYRTWLRSNVMVNGGGSTYLGKIDLSQVPDLISNHYPDDKDEIVFDNRSNRLTVSISFTRPMDRESVEAAFSTEPATEGIFYWGQYASSPSYYYYEDAYLSGGWARGAVITTYSNITSFTYRFSMKDSFVDTTYTVRLATTAKDTSGNFLQFPLEYDFSTVQSSTTLNGISTFPYHGDVNVGLVSNNGISITFPRNMDVVTTEAAISVTPDINRIYIWPAQNQLTIYTGGPFKSETDFKVTIDASAKDLDGFALGNPFSFEFNTEAIKIASTSPNNGQLFIDPNSDITLWFNTYMTKSSVQNAFSISPNISGSFKWGTSYSTENRAITFMPSQSFSPNTKYTVTINNSAKDLYGDPMAEPYTFSFITRPE